MKLVRANFRPEFLNRLDEIVIFSPLAIGQLRRIVDLNIRSLQKSLEENQIHLHLTDGAKDLILQESFDPTYGARPLQRYMARTLATQLSKFILSGVIQPKQLVVIGRNSTVPGEFTFVISADEKKNIIP